MKQKWMYYSLLFAAITIMSCGDDTAENVPTPNTPKTQSEATILPVTKYYSAEEFLALFTNRTWNEWEVHDVYADSTIGGNVLREIDGYAPMTIRVIDKSTMNVNIKYEDPHISAHDTLLVYRFEDGNKFQFGKDDCLYECYHSPMTVLEINDTVMRCLGSVFAPNRSNTKEQKPVAGLFLFHRR